MKRAWVTVYWIVMSVLIIIIAYLLYQRYIPELEFVQTPKSHEEEQPKALAPNFELEDLNGNLVRLANFKGKIVLLNFWTTWCPDCVREIPALNSANEEFMQGEDAVLLAINVMEDKDVVKRFAEKNDLNFTVLMDYDASIYDLYGVRGYPTTIVIDRDGAIIRHVGGAVSEQWLLSIVETYK